MTLARSGSEALPSTLRSVAPNLYQIVLPTPFPVGPVNVYLAVGEQLVLVDTGPNTPEAQATLRQALTGLGLSLAALDWIIVSHAHADHYGLAAKLVHTSGARLWSHPRNRPTLEDYVQDRRQRVAFYAETLIQAGVPPDVMAHIERVFQGYGRFAQAVRVDGELQEEDSVALAGQTWHVLAMPGHSGGLICLYQPELRLLLSNDHLLRDISSNPLLEPPPPGERGRSRPLVDYIASLKRTAALEVDVAWPGHGEPITDHCQLIARRLAFHQERGRKIRAVLQNGPSTVYQIVQVLFSRLQPDDYFLAVSEVMGHLEWLESRGEVFCQQQRERLVWSNL